MFALMMALSNIGTAIGEEVATGLTDDIGFAAVFWILAAINALNAHLVGPMQTNSGGESANAPAANSLT